MIKFFLTRVLKWIASLSWNDFIGVVNAAKRAAELWSKSNATTRAENAAINTNRAEYVSAYLTKLFPKLPTWEVNVIRELAVAWLNRSAK